MYKDFFYDAYFNKSWHLLYELNCYLIKHISKEFLGVKTEFADSKQFKSCGENADKLLSLLLSIGVKDYVSGPAAKTYINEEQFKQVGINVIWKDYCGYPEYKQIKTPFEHGVSIVDVLFNTGDKAADYIWNWRKTSVR